VEKAIERGISEIAFTDHIPLYFLPPEKRDPKLAMREEQFDGYVAEVRALQQEFAGAIAIRLGLEADYAEGFEEDLARWLGRVEWDLVLGSVHWVAGDWIDSPGARDRFSREGTEFLYREYYRLLAKAARTGFFDVLTHFDLPKKFGVRPGAPLESDEDRAIEAARAARCAVEISSAGLRKPIAEMYPEARILRKLVAAGVAVTFSSDSHAPAEIGWGYAKIAAEARSCGVREFATFERRKRRMNALPDA
jgi:histidinol-phosphatase (PHP family)